MRKDRDNKYSVGGTILSGMIGAYIGYKYAEKKKKGRKLFSKGGGVKHSYEIEQEGDEFVVEFYKSDGKLDWGKGGFSSREEAEKYALENRTYAEGGEVEDFSEFDFQVGDKLDLGSKGIKYFKQYDGEKIIVVDSKSDLKTSKGSSTYPSSVKKVLNRKYAEGGAVSEYWKPIDESSIYRGVHDYSLDGIDDNETLLEGEVWIKFKSIPKGVTNLPYEVKRAIESDFEYYGYSNSEYPKSVSLNEGSWFDYYISFKNLTYQELEDLLIKLPEQVAESLEEQGIEGYGELGFYTYGNYIDAQISSDYESEEDEYEYAKGGSIDNEIAQYKKQLISKAKTRGLYENFGQNEVRKLEAKYGYTNEVRAFDNWAMNFDLSQIDRYAKGGEVDEDVYFAVVKKKGDKNYDKIGYSKSSEFIEDKQGNKFDKLYFGNKKTPTKYNAEDINYSVIELDEFTSTSGRKFILLKENTEDGRRYYYILHSDDKSVYTESYDMAFIKSELKRLTNGKNFYAKAGVNFAKGGGISDVVVYDNGGESFDRYTIFTPDGSVYGMSDNALMPNGFNMYIGDDTEIQKGSHLGKKLKSVPQSIKIAVERRMNEEYAKGGEVNYTKKWEVIGINRYGKKFKEIITLGRMSDKEDVKNALRRRSDLNISEVTSIKEVFAKGGGVGEQFYVGQTIKIDENNNPYGKMTKDIKKIISPYLNKELVIEEITIKKPYNSAKAYLKSSGEKVPFDIVLNKKYIQTFAGGGFLSTEEQKRFEELDEKMNAYLEGKGEPSSKEMLEHAKLKHKRNLAKNPLYKKQMDWEKSVEGKGKYAGGGSLETSSWNVKFFDYEHPSYFELNVKGDFDNESEALEQAIIEHDIYVDSDGEMFWNGSPISFQSAKKNTNTRRMSEGGGIGFKGLSAKVAKRYEGKKVAPKYQSQYGTTYSKSEAKEVGDKVAGKVYWNQQGRKMAKGGGVTDKLSYADFVETLRDNDQINAYTGKETRGMEMYYLPSGHPFLGLKFPHKNKRKAYNEYVNIGNKIGFDSGLNFLSMAKGGLTEHGLKVGDKIERKLDAEGSVIKVKNKRENAFVELDSGYRMPIYEFSSMAKGGGVESITPALNEKVMKRSLEIYHKNGGKTIGDFVEANNKAIKEFGYNPQQYHKIMSEIGSEYEDDDDFAKGGGVYSSDDLYELLVFDVETGVFLGSERFRAKNIREAQEMGEEYEDKYKKKYRENLRFKVQLAPSMFQEKGGLMANGGGVDNEMIIAGVVHKEEPNVKYYELLRKGAKEIESSHPRGTIWVLGNKAYVSSGYSLYSFNKSDIPKIQKAYQSGNYANGGGISGIEDIIRG